MPFFGSLGILITRVLVVAAVVVAVLSEISTLAGTGSIGFSDGSVQFNNPRGIAIHSSGIMYVVDETNARIRRITPEGVVSTLAGSGTAGFQDGTGTSARFNQPFGVAVNSAGTVYVADRMNHRIRRITPEGVVTTFAGGATSGGNNGTGTNATFTQPIGIAVDSAGTVYVADTGNNRIRMITPLGVVTTLAGNGQAVFADGPGANATFSSPYGVAVDLSGNVYVADTFFFRVRKITAGVVTTLAGNGTQDVINGTGAGAQFNSLWNITTDSVGNVYVTDQLCIRMITPAGVVTTYAGNGMNVLPTLIGDGIANNVGINPFGLAFDSSKNLFITEQPLNRIRKVSPGGVVTTVAGSGVSGFTDSVQTSLFAGCSGVAVNSVGNVYVADTDNHCIRMITPEGFVTTLAGNGTQGTADGIGMNARFNAPRGIAVDLSGNLHVADTGNSKVRRITPTGVVSSYTFIFGAPYGITVGSTGIVYVADSARHYIDSYSSVTDGYVGILAGYPNTAGFSNATGMNARFRNPSGVTTDPSGNIYVADSGNNCVRKITSIGNVTVLAGPRDTAGIITGMVDSTDPHSVRFSSPVGITIDSTGTLFVGDSNNYRIRRITSVGETTTVAGDGSIFQDGNVISARFVGPRAVAVHSSGRLYVADSGSHRIRMIFSNTVSTIGGSSTSGFTDGGWFNQPVGVATDWDGTMYLADTNNHRIRKVTPAGVVTTFAGSATAGSTNSTGTNARFNFPRGTALDSAGNVYVADSASRQIRRITPAGVVSTFAGSTTSGFADGTGTSATFNTPVGITVDPVGTIYVSDIGNHNIRRITSAGVVTTLAGSRTATFADGVGTNAAFNTPSGIVADIYGNVYVADTNNQRIRRVTSDGTVTTLAGSTAGYADETGTNARFYFPYHLSIDVLGTLYVADQTNNRIRTIQTSTGVVSTLAGDGTAGFTPSRFNTPQGITVDRFRNAYVADSGNHSIRKIANIYTSPISSVVTTLAGSGTSSFIDGTGTNASFELPSAMTVDYLTGNIIVVDNLRIRRITPAGVVTFLAGSGSATFGNGTGAGASFNYPEGVVVNSLGNVFVGDTMNHRIRMITPAGVVTTFSGSGTSGTTNGVATSARFNQPCGVVLWNNGAIIYVVETAGNCIRAVETSGGYANKDLGTGFEQSVDGIGVNASFQNPFGIALSPSLSFVMYVTELGSHRIRRIDGGYRVTTFAGSSQGYQDGVGTNAQFNTPRGIAVDFRGNVYVADTGNNRIRMITPAGVVSTLLGNGTTVFSNGTGTNSGFNSPWGVAVDFAGTLYVTDRHNTRIRIIRNPTQVPLNRGVVTTLAGSTSGSTNATGTNATFASPSGVAVDSQGNIYVSDRGNNLIRKITPAGVVTTLAGQTTAGSTNATGTSASFRVPSGVAVNSAGDVYVADNNNFCIRKITSTGVVTTFAGIAGQGTQGYADGTATAAKFNYPNGVAVDSGGFVYVADTDNNRIRKITPLGVVSTFAGQATTGSTDAAGTNAQFNLPLGVAVDSAGNVYVADQFNNRIRKITAAGVVSTFAGSTAGFADGTGAGAQFNKPYGVAVDSAGNVYVADAYNNRIRRITPSGVVTTLAGQATSGSGNGTETNATFNFPWGVTIDSGGIMYLADFGNHRIRKIQ